MTTRPCSHAFFLGLLAFFAAPMVSFAALIVNENSAWPTNAAVETFEPTAANVESERDLRFTRDLTQTFQVASGFQLSKIFIDYEEGIADKQVTIHLFEVADVTGGGVSGGFDSTGLVDLLGGGAGLAFTTTAAIASGDGGNNPFAVMEFDLTGADEVQLNPTVGTAGYAFQIERTGTGADIDDGLQRAFKWHFNDGNNLFASGRSFDSSGSGPDDATDDLLMALVAVPEPATVALGLFAAASAVVVCRRRTA